MDNFVCKLLQVPSPESCSSKMQVIHATVTFFWFSSQVLQICLQQALQVDEVSEEVLPAGRHALFSGVLCLLIFLRCGFSCPLRLLDMCFFHFPFAFVVLGFLDITNFSSVSMHLFHRQQLLQIDIFFSLNHQSILCIPSQHGLILPPLVFLFT